MTWTSTVASTDKQSRETLAPLAGKFTRWLTHLLYLHFTKSLSRCEPAAALAGAHNGQATAGPASLLGAEIRGNVDDERDTLIIVRGHT